MVEFGRGRAAWIWALREIDRKGPEPHEKGHNLRAWQSSNVAQQFGGSSPRVALLSPFRGRMTLENLRCNSPTCVGEPFFLANRSAAVKRGVHHGLFVTHTASSRNLESKKRKQAQAS